MNRNIIICCDGTGNQPDESYSNVVKLYSVIDKMPGQQIGYYDPGVGTLPYDKVVFPIIRRAKKVIDLALGRGLEDNVTEAYSFLMQNYEKGDNIYLFGFSRGAYTVRVLAGLIKVMGLLDRNCQHLIPYAWSYYRECFRPDLKATSARFKEYFSRDVDIHFVGLWDTVSSVGLLGGYKHYPFTRTNDKVLNLRHAMAIDERRRFYRQNLFVDINNNANMKQVWFAGVHSDVGGSYPLDESGLSQISLQWMLREAAAAGLIINPTTLASVIPVVTSNGISAPDLLAEIHDAFKGGWWFAEYFPKRDRLSKKLILPRGQWRRMFIGPDNKPLRPTIHQSVIDRMKLRTDYRPEHLDGQPTSNFNIEM